MLIMILWLVMPAQDCEFYFPAREGALIEMKHYTEKDKLSGTSIMRVLSRVENDQGLELTVESEFLDEKENSQTKGQLVLRCSGGVFYMDMKNYFDQQALAQYEDMDIEIEASDPELPANMHPGMALKDASMTMKVKSGGMNMFTFQVDLTNRKVEAREEITTPAGVFDCFKITYDIETKMLMKISARGAEWMCRDVGMVRSESYNKNGKLTGYTVLTAIR